MIHQQIEPGLLVMGERSKYLRINRSEAGRARTDDDRIMSSGL
jgi:hypothetical protein